MVDVHHRRLRHRGGAADRRANRLWSSFAVPGVAWLVAFFVAAVYAVAAVAFGRIDPLLRMPIPAWNPVDWDFDAMVDVLGLVFGGDLGHVVIRTFEYVALALAGCIAIGYPIAYFVARVAKRSRGPLLLLLVLPFWISYLMRMLAWTNLLQSDGFVNRALGWIGLMDQPRTWLDGSASTVVIGLIYGYVPFFLLPMFSALERIDGRFIEAARDLGASRAQAFARVTLPLSVPGLMAASVVTVLPMFGDYYTNTFLTSGSPRTEMIGNQIEFFLRGSAQPQKGASLVLVLMAMLFALMVYYLVATLRQQRAMQR